MPSMWMRRVMSAIATAVLAAVLAVLDIEGYVLLFAFGLAVLIAMFVGFAGEAWLKGHRRRSLS